MKSNCGKVHDYLGMKFDFTRKGKVKVEPAFKPPCLKCGHRKLRLLIGDGWYCKSCNAGPYLIDTEGLIFKKK